MAPSNCQLILINPNINAVTAAPPLGLGYLAAMTRKAGIQVAILDCVRDRLTERSLGDLIDERAPALIGLSVYSCDYEQVRRLIARWKRQLPESKIILGGPHVNALPSFSLSDTGADYALVGEAESTLPQLAIQLLNGNELAQGIAGTYRRELDTITMTPGRPVVSELDEVGEPAWDLLKPERYPPTPHQLLYREWPVAPIITTRGCPYRCKFCSSGSPELARVFRKRSPEAVVDEMAYLSKQRGIRELHLEDDNFTFERRHAEAVCELMLKRGLKTIWSCPNGVRIDSLDKELLRLMKRAGCYRVGLGIESFDSSVRRLAGKELDPEEITRVIDWCRELGLESIGFFMVGLPGETAVSLQRTINCLKRSRLDFASFGYFTPLPGTPFFQDSYRESDLAKIQWGRLNETNPHASLALPTSALVSAYRTQWLQFFGRPRRIGFLLHNIKLKQVAYFLRAAKAYLSFRK